MNYAKVIFLKEVGAFVGSDGKVYGPYRPGDEAVIPEDDAKALALRGAAARIGGYVVEEGVKPDFTTLRGRSEVESRFSPLMLMSIGFSLVIVGFILMSFSAMKVSGAIAVFPFPPIVVSGPEAVLIAILPLAVILIFIALFLYLVMRF